MGRVKRGGYVIEWWIGDHYPKHVHVYRNRKEVAKVVIPDLIVLTGKVNRKLVNILHLLMREKKI